MVTSKKSIESEIIKTKPTVFPLGFTIGQVKGGLIIIDFIDVFNGKHTIIESIALSSDKANQLAEALIEAVKNDELDR